MAFTGVTIVFVVMMIILPPLSFFIVRENFDALTLLFIGAFTWYLPALGLASGVWRGIDLV